MLPALAPEIAAADGKVVASTRIGSWYADCAVWTDKRELGTVLDEKLTDIHCLAQAGPFVYGTWLHDRTNAEFYLAHHSYVGPSLVEGLDYDYDQIEIDGEKLAVRQTSLSRASGGGATFRGFEIAPHVWVDGPKLLYAFFTANFIKLRYREHSRIAHWDDTPEPSASSHEWRHRYTKNYDVRQLSDVARWCEDTMISIRARMNKPDTQQGTAPDAQTH